MKLFNAIKFVTKETIILLIIIFISYVIWKILDKFLGKCNLPKSVHNIIYIMSLIILMILVAYIFKPIYFK